MQIKGIIFLSVAIFFGIVVMISSQILTQWRQKASLLARLEKVVPVGAQSRISCAEVAAKRPLVLLALGQSNAANHGPPPDLVDKSVILVAEGKCLETVAPLPGGTGEGDSIWPRLPELLSAQLDGRPVVLSVLAIDATTIGDWTSHDSPLRARLASHLSSLKDLNLAPSLVLWQHGEADAHIDTTSTAYEAGLMQLLALLDVFGIHAPVLLARSTICRSSPSERIRQAIDSAVANDPRFRVGPDTDSLSGDAFRDGCHFTAKGLDSAAKMWALAIAPQINTEEFIR